MIRKTKRKSKTNILSKRRVELGIDRYNNKSSINYLVSKGVKIGTTFLTSSIIICILSLGYFIYSGYKKDSLKHLDDEYQQLQNKLNNISLQISEIKKTNKTLATSIAGIGSSSALLKEISNLTPTSIQINTIETGQAGIKILGIAPQINGLKVINAFQLSIGSSPFFIENSVKVIKANKSTRNNRTESIKSNYLNFEIVAAFNNEIDSIKNEDLIKLDSLGLSQRIEMLKREGLIQ